MNPERYKTMLTAVILGCVLTVILATPLWGQQAYPAKPVNLLIGYAPGGVVDISERSLASKAEKNLGQPILVSNNGGGGSSVAFEITARKAPDGYNIVGGASTGLVRIPQFREVPYKMDDFIPIMHFATPILTPVVTKSTSPWKTFKELIQYAKTNPGKLTYSTTGVGSPMHMAMEYIGGHVTFQVGAGESVPFIKDGTVRLLANLSERRVKSWPDTPTLIELGYDFFNESVFMFAAPKGTPRPIVDKLDDAFHKAMADPEFISVLARVEFEPSYRNSADTRKYLEDAYSRIGRMIHELKIPKEPGEKK